MFQLRATPTHATPIYDALSQTIPYFVPPSLRASLLDGTSPLLSWQPGRTPFSTGTSVLLAGAGYLAIIFTGQALMQKFKVQAFKLKQPFVLHNFLLSVCSGLLLACMLEEILPLWKRNGFYYAICAEQAWTKRMETLYIFNYIFKFWELGDTVFLVLKKKPLAFLHVYHHSATALLCFSQLLGKTSVSWVVITLNLFVHVIMYAYYMLTALRIPCPWKKAVTSTQILQFVLDLGVIYYASYNYFVNAYGLGKTLPNHGKCAAGKEHAVWSGCTILSSYLVLFIAFYQKTYKSKKAAGEAHTAFAKTAKQATSLAAEKDMISGTGGASQPASVANSDEKKRSSKSSGNA
ncbi:ELO-domain-containing protein [Tilletiaria anomala UBC 951]|uniref:Elongation of fatty acids protein n=1 Tax=Tilletiaria anomala (strain ATCC 24038 / CBS 436.72 / UBC 951) TaxID=1037660 RepID=A0A066VWT0_TILAU|nr:ELO-domain-containing protein [Tilletiaria anomala UBC 951]KDN43000.1 ELO-domain-containing protein [Tilletiaria anomala UBC 951]